MGVPSGIRLNPGKTKWASEKKAAGERKVRKAPQRFKREEKGQAYKIRSVWNKIKDEWGKRV